MEHTSNFILFEGALNDDTLYVADNGYCFGKNPKHKVLVEYYTYANEWGNHKHTFKAESVENAIKRYRKATNRLQLQDAQDLICSIEECFG